MYEMLDWYECSFCKFKFSWEWLSKEGIEKPEQCPNCRCEKISYKGKGIIYPNMRNEDGK
jgi:predicted Zn-ribbon and HTH transcriptional regulator